MFDPTTILDYATRQRDDAILAVAAAQRQLGEAQSAIAAESENLARATGAFSDLNKQADETARSWPPRRLPPMAWRCSTRLNNSSFVRAPNAPAP